MLAVTSMLQMIKRGCYALSYIRSKEMEFKFELVPRTEGVLNFGTLKNVGRGTAVGIATWYGLDGPGIESRWRRSFPHPSRLALGPIHGEYRFFPPGLGVG